MKKNCLVCDSEFDTKDRSNNSVYCSKECNYKQHLIRCREYRNKRKDNPEFIRKQREANKRLRIKKRKYKNPSKVTKECYVCKKEFTGNHKRKTCSTRYSKDRTCFNVYQREKYWQNKYIKMITWEAPETGKCEYCKDTIIKLRPHKQYCNETCRQKAQYIRLKKEGYYNKVKLQ
tara:strand:- start:38 stop:562 length:525 start_codon:yes stop_codon:yes gene_type:complete